MSGLSEKVAAVLKSLMFSKGLSQTQVADKSGLTGVTVNAFCNGRGKILAHSLELIAETLDTNAEAIIAQAVSEPGDLDRGALAREVAQAVVAELKKTSNDLGLMFPESEPDLRKIIELLSVFKPHQMTEALSYVREMHKHVMDSRAENAKKKAQQGA